MRKRWIAIGIAVILFVNSSRSLLPGRDATETAARTRESAEFSDRQARILGQETLADIEAGKFYAANFDLPESVSASDPLSRYIPERKRRAIRSVAGIALWPRPQDGKSVDRNTLPSELYGFLQGFFRTLDAPLTERERRLIAFGQMQAPPARKVYDAEALTAWFRNELSIDIRERQFLFHTKLELPSSHYDVDREQWVLEDPAVLVPSRIGDIVLRFGAFGVRGTAFALVPVNLSTIAAKLGRPLIIPMKFDAASCHEMTAYYRFYPVNRELSTHHTEAAMEAQASPETSTSLERLTIPVQVSEMHLYCTGDKQLLWSHTF